MQVAGPSTRRFSSAFFSERPAAIFALLALVFGAATIAAAPPLRGPDESAHFVRAYGFAHGQFIPRLTDEAGRKGLMLPAPLAADVGFFNAFRHGGAEYGGFRGVFAEHARRREQHAAAVGQPDVFWLYEGGEAYSPVSYLPAIAAIWVAQLAKLGFLATLYLMRAASLLAYTAVTAVAIARVPYLPWAFVAIAMLPSSIYGRSVVSADGAALATCLTVTALALRAAAGWAGGAWRRSLWMALCALAKPPQLAFVLLEAMARPWRDRRHWRVAALAVVPALVLLPLWIALIGAEMGAWRLYGEGWGRPEEFNALWKLRYLLEHPLHFPSAVRVSLDYAPELWRQGIGVLGWLDVRLRAWAYPAIAALLACALLQHLPLDRATRTRVGLVAAAVALGYVVAVFLIFYLTSTPVVSPRVEGVQGRYFTVALAPAAIALAAFLPRGLPVAVLAGSALALALLSGLATIEALLRADWLTR